MAIKLGQRVRDRITGFTGMVTGRCEYISGCHQVLVVSPVDSSGKLVESQWYDEQRCEVTDAEAFTLDNSKTPGCDMEAPKR